MARRHLASNTHATEALWDTVRAMCTCAYTCPSQHMPTVPSTPAVAKKSVLTPKLYIDLCTQNHERKSRRKTDRK